MSSGVRTREYLTVHRNSDIIIRSLADWGDPGLLAQKLCEVDLVSRDVLEGACIREVTPSNRIQRVVSAVQSQINLESSKYDVFVRILKVIHPLLAEKVTKYFATNLELNAPRAVSSVCNWEELAHQIDYDPIKLTRLQSSGYSLEKCREELVTDWARQGDASWMKLARALDRMNEAHLAEEIRRQYLPSPEHEDDSSASSLRDDRLTVSPKTDSDVAREIEGLENRFCDLVFEVQMEIEDEMDKRQTSHKRWAIRKLQNNLSYLPATIRPDHYEFVRENLDTISEAESVHKIFNYLNLYWSFIDCNLLEHLIIKFGSEGLQAQMASYIADLVRFRKSTTVAQFAKQWPSFGGKKTPPPHFSELKAKLPDDPSTCTLEYVENLRIDLCREFFLSRSALVLAGVNPGSVVVVWYVPSSITPLLSVDLSKYEGKLFHGYGVTELHLSQFFDHLCGIHAIRDEGESSITHVPGLSVQCPSPVLGLTHSYADFQLPRRFTIKKSFDSAYGGEEDCTPPFMVDRMESVDSIPEYLGSPLLISPFRELMPAEVKTTWQTSLSAQFQPTEAPSAGTLFSGSTGSPISMTKPRLEIVEQPKSRGFRFRYECEGQSHGGLPGENSDKNRKQKTYPTVRLVRYRGRARVMVSLVSDTDPPVPHAHSIVGKNADDGRCLVEIGPETDMYALFPNLGILHVTKKKVPDVLLQRLMQQVQMNETSLEHLDDTPSLTEEQMAVLKEQAAKYAKSMNLSIVRLCFQAFLMDEHGRFTIPVDPVFSNKVYDSKAPSAGTLKICRLDRTSGSVRGGDIIFLLCDKVQKNDIEVILYEEKFDSTLNPVHPWTAKGRFRPHDVHDQRAIVFSTPPYFNLAIERPVHVYIALRRPSDSETSEPKPFMYLPLEFEESDTDSDDTNLSDTDPEDQEDWGPNKV